MYHDTMAHGTGNDKVKCHISAVPMQIYWAYYINFDRRSNINKETKPCVCHCTGFQANNSSENEISSISNGVVIDMHSVKVMQSYYMYINQW